MPPITIGTATAIPGQISTGWFEGIPLPTGNRDDFPVIIAQGQQEGPTLWVTTGIHGSEHTGLIAIHRLLNNALLGSLRGTLIAIPALSPAGLRTKDRSPYTHMGDPNRIFPAPGRSKDRKQSESQSGLESAYVRLFDAIMETDPVGLIDLHNAWIGSIPFVFRDPVFYRKGRSRLPGLNRAEAQSLQNKVGELLDAFGFTIVNEFAAEGYIAKNLHRSVSGSVLNAGGIPSITVELGSWRHIDPFVVEACTAGLRNILRWAEMLGGEMEAITDIPVIDPGYAVRREMAPHMPESGIVHHLIRPGDSFSEGDPLAQITDIFGQPLGADSGYLRSQHNGYVIGWQHGVIHYQGQTLMGLAIQDESPLVVPYPD